MTSLKAAIMNRDVEVAKLQFDAVEDAVVALETTLVQALQKAIVARGRCLMTVTSILTAEKVR